MDLLLLLKGIAIGVAIAVPVGPVAILCIRRTLMQGPGFGFATGFGASLADTIFGAIAALGVVAVSDVLMTYEMQLRAVGGAFLLALGVQTWLKSDDKERKADSSRWLRAFLSAFMITITNPLTIFAFTFIFASFGVVNHAMTPGATWTLILGIAVGATVWWCGLTGLATGLRAWVGAHRNFVWLHHLSGGLLVIFGLATLGSIFVV